MTTPPEPDAPPEPERRGLRVREPRRAVVAPTLIVLNALVFGAMLASGLDLMQPGGEELLRWGAGNASRVAEGEWWRLLACAFVHAGVLHLGFNMLALRSLGIVERLYGNGAFLTLYVGSALGGSIASCLSNPTVTSVGASGAVFGLVGALLAFFLRHRRAMPPELFRRMLNNLLLILAINLSFGLVVPNIDNAAHLGGLLFGFAGGFALDRDPLEVPRLGLRRIVRAALLGLALAGLALAIPWRVANSSEIARVELEERAELALRGEQWELAAELSLELLAEDPESARGHEILGIARISLEDHATGRAELDRALELDPDLPRALVLRGQLRGDDADFEGAHADFDRLVAILAPEHAAIGLSLRGLVAYARQDWPAARRDLERVLGLDEKGENREEVELLAWLARAREGELDAARRSARERLAAVRSGSRATAHREELELLAGERDEPSQDRGWTWFVQGTLARLEGDEARARRAFEAALTAADRSEEAALLARAELAR